MKKYLWPIIWAGAISGIVIACNNWLPFLDSRLTPWEIVEHNGDYGYVDWNHLVTSGFTNYQSAHDAMVKHKEWSDKFDEEYRMKRSREYWQTK